MTAFDLGRVLWEARIREAWGPHAETMLARNPWPKHAASHELSVEHHLCIVQAKAALKHIGDDE